KMKLDLLKKNNIPKDVSASLGDIGETLNDSIHYTRQLMSELKPPPGLKDAEFEDMLYWLKDKMKQHDLKVVIEDGVKTKPLPGKSRIILQQSIRELLFNVVKHAGVNEAHINLENTNGKLKIDVKDNGEGFKLEGKNLRPTRDGGFGLFNIKERIEMIGGKFKIKSKPGDGTMVTLLAPLKVAQEPTGQEPTGQEPTGQEPTGQAAAILDKNKVEPIKVLLVDDHQM